MYACWIDRACNGARKGDIKARKNTKTQSQYRRVNFVKEKQEKKMTYHLLSSSCAVTLKRCGVYAKYQVRANDSSYINHVSDCDLFTLYAYRASS